MTVGPLTANEELLDATLPSDARKARRSSLLDRDPPGYPCPFFWFVVEPEPVPGRDRA